MRAANTSKILFWLILLLGLSLRLTMAWQPVELLIQKTLPDDAFYYLMIARNIIGGHGVSVDGVTSTNGFHPLWAILLLLPYSVWRSGDIPVHVSLSLAALVDMFSAFIAYDLARRIMGRTSAGLLAAFFMPSIPWPQWRVKTAWKPRWPHAGRRALGRRIIATRSRDCLV